MTDELPEVVRPGGPPSPFGRANDRAATLLRRADFAAFYRAEVGRLVGFVMKIGAGEHEAAEAAQAALAHAWTAWDSIHSNRRAWVRTVAVREFYRQTPRHEFSCFAVPDRPGLFWPETIVEISERARAAQDLLSGLPTMQRHVMAWIADGFTTAEIARATGRTEPAIRKNLQRARDTLKARLAEDQGGIR